MRSRVNLRHLDVLVAEVPLPLCIPADLILPEDVRDQISFIARWCEIVHEVAEEIIKLDLGLLSGVFDGLEDVPGVSPPHLSAGDVLTVPSLNQDGSSYGSSTGCGVFVEMVGLCDATSHDCSQSPSLSSHHFPGYLSVSFQFM